MARGKKILLFLLTAIALFVWYAVFAVSTKGEIAVTFFDVGQGDAALIQTNDGTQILIDGGPGKIILAKLGKAMPYWDREIELIILTHPHADHVDGLIEALKIYKVKAVLDSGASYHTADYAEWRQLLEKQHIPLVIAKAGQRIHISQSAYLDVLAPFEDVHGQSFKNIHDAMVVTRLTVREQHSVLFAGDAERRLEFELTTRLPADLLNADIVKIGHHGSKTSSSDLFLNAVSPNVAVISAGSKNRFGHPHREVLDRLERMGIFVRRTDIEGDIIYSLPF